MFGYSSSSSSSSLSPILLIKSGPTLSSLVPVPVNHPTESIAIETDQFKGLINVRIVNFRGPGDLEKRDYIENPLKAEGGGFTNKENASWSIVVQGRFLEEVKVGDLMWGNIWSKPIRDSLPPGTALITKYMQMRDPSVTLDLQSDSPHAFSPWLSTTQFVTISSDSSSDLPPFDPSLPIPEDVTSLFSSHPSNQSLFTKSQPGKDLTSWIGEPKYRKEFFGNPVLGNEAILGKEMVILAEFAHGHIDFKTLSLKLPLLPNLPLAKYWDGQPITFVLRNKKTHHDYLYITFAIGSEELNGPTSTSSGSGSNSSSSSATGGEGSTGKSTPSGQEEEKEVVKGGEVD